VKFPAENAMENAVMLVEALVAFALIFLSTVAIYGLGRKAATAAGTSVDERASYACGENVSFSKLKVNVSLYKYLVYFVIFDSSVLLVTFAAFSVASNPFFVLLYLGILLAAGLALLGGARD
jgi:NADH:ubiquinone oxidoreductase subunit 3 (subunit A)